MKNKKTMCQHEWFITRELGEAEKRITGKEIEVKCTHCGRKGFVNYRDLSWMQRR